MIGAETIPATYQGGAPVTAYRISSDQQADETSLISRVLVAALLAISAVLIPGEASRVLERPPT